MPNLVVYVPTSLWKRIEELGLSDPKVEARRVAVGALERYVTDGKGAPGRGVVAGIEPDSVGDQEIPENPPRTASRPSPSECGMFNRHHMNSRQNPCPRCGYPL